jgi:uncharacterized integral membrane protein
MAGLIVIVVLGSLIAYFATQNTSDVSVVFVGYLITIPLYVVVIGSLLVGFIISWVFSLVDSISSFLKIHGKETKIKKDQKEIEDLKKQIRELELENENLKGQTTKSN